MKISLQLKIVNRTSLPTVVKLLTRYITPICADMCCQSPRHASPTSPLAPSVLILTIHDSSPSTLPCSWPSHRRTTQISTQLGRHVVSAIKSYLWVLVLMTIKLED